MKFSFAASLAAAITLSVATTAHAGTVLFNFEDQAPGTQTAFTSTSGSLSATFGSPDDFPAFGLGAFVVSSNFLTATGFQYRLLQNNFLTTNNDFSNFPASSLTVTFSEPIDGLSFLFALDGASSTTNLSVTTNAGAAFTTSGTTTTTFPTYPEGFFSFVSRPFTVATFSSNGADFQLDNLSAVPEPGTWLLLGVGLVPLLVARRRAKR